MTTDIDTLATALYVTTDDLLKAFPEISPLFKPLRQTIESINQTLKGQLDLERHGGHTCNGVAIRVLQRILALTAVIWHNEKICAPIKRSLIAYDH